MNELFIASAILITLFLIANIPQWIGMNSSRYGTAVLKKRTRLLRKSNKGLVIGGKKRMSERDSLNHLLCVAPTGSGKTSNFVLPNILMLENSFVTIDIKGELEALTGAAKEKQGFKRIVIDLGDIEKSSQYNLLKRVRSDSDVREFCESLFEMSNNGATTEGIWKNGAITILEIMTRCLRNIHLEMEDKGIAYELDPYPNMANLIHLVNSINIAQFGSNLNDFVSLTGQSPIDGNRDTIEMFTQWQRQEIKILAGQHANAMSVLSSFNLSELKQLTNGDDFDFSEFRKSKIALYIKVPVGKMVAYSGFLTLFFFQFFDYLLNNNPTEEDNIIYFLMEEIGNLKRIKNFGQICSLIRSQKVSLSLIAQDLTQFDHIYGPSEANTIVSNCATHLILAGILNHRSLDFYGKLIGTETNQEVGADGKIFISKRELLTIDEIRRIKRDEALFLYSNQNPVKIKLTPLFKNQRLMAKAGIKSINGKSVSTLPLAPIKNRILVPIKYIDLASAKTYCEQRKATSKTISEPLEEVPKTDIGFS